MTSEPTAPRAQGSQYEKHKPRAKSRSWRRRLRRAVKAPFVALLAWLGPRVLFAYCWFVWKTSRVEDDLQPHLRDAAERHDRFVAILWHQEVLTVAFAYRKLHPHTLASTKDVGRLITRALEYCGYVVFRRGGSHEESSGFAIRAMIEHMEEDSRVGYGVTVDGSHGPRFRVKPGAVKIVNACRAPLYCVGTQFSWRIELPTWDRTVIPLPFGRIRMDAVGPYWVDPEGGRGEVKAFRNHIERELLELHWRQREDLDGRPPSGPKCGLPEGWQPSWTNEDLGLPRTSHDLKPHDPPPWAHLPNDRGGSDTEVR